MKVKNMKPSGEEKKKKKVLRCPHCGSDDITYELGLITGYKYHCKKCQYVGVLVVEDEDEGK